MKTKVFFLLCILFVSIQLRAQDTILVSRHFDKSSIGVGFGLDYGGIGASILVYPVKYIGFFAGGGYALAGTGYNVGTKIRFVSGNHRRSVFPYLLAMYGYHTAIKIKDASEYDKMFYGVTFGMGFDVFGRNPRGYWSFGILVPLRGPEVQNYIDDLKNNHNVEFKNDLMPFAITVGYRFFIF